MNKLLLIIPVALLIATGCTKVPSTATENAQQQINMANSEADNWPTYTNAKYGFEFKHPSSWRASNELNTLFTFQTAKGHVAQFRIESFVPYEFDEQRKTQLKASAAHRAITIGKEEGLQEGGIGCEFGNSCFANFNFLSNQLTTRGFSFSVLIPGLKDTEVDRSPGSAYNPYPLFEKEIEEIEKVLATFEYVR